MSNICETAIAFFATDDKYTDKLMDFYNRLTDLQTFFETEPNFNSIYLAAQFGIDSRHVEWSCIQDISDIEAHGTYRGFKVYQDDKWCPSLSLWNLIIELYYTSENGERMIDYVYEAEEPGCEIYINTDVDGEFFCDLYKVDAYLPEELYYGEYVTEYFSNSLDLSDFLESFAMSIPEYCKDEVGLNGQEFVDSYVNSINSYIQSNHPNSGYYLSVHEFKEE